jgi:hypothetical protein
LQVAGGDRAAARTSDDCIVAVEIFPAERKELSGVETEAAWGEINIAGARGGCVGAAEDFSAGEEKL